MTAENKENPLEIRLWKSGGPKYWTRNGQAAVVLEANCDLDDLGKNRCYYEGRVDGKWTQWDINGKHRGGNAEFDLVGVCRESV